jgi:hypothetical protein
MQGVASCKAASSNRNLSSCIHLRGYQIFSASQWTTNLLLTLVSAQPNSVSLLHAYFSSFILVISQAAWHLQYGQHSPHS